ncbi:MAG: glycosyltransferase family 2 protein [Desulfobulbus sp.]
MKGNVIGSGIKVSLIVTTYNWKEALEVVLRSAFEQTFLPIEIVVADDGSRPDTAALIRRLTSESPVPLVHVWQEDIGFRVARIRNQALVKAQGQYIVFLDGDMVLDQNFIVDHLMLAREGWFVQGPRALVGEKLTQQILGRGRLQLPIALQGIGNKKNCLRSIWLSQLFSWEASGLHGIRLCNFSLWKQDALRVNGFNEDFEGWGREDSEFVARLLNIGVRRQNLRFRALGYHLHHPINERNRLVANDRLLQNTIEKRLVWCENGLGQSNRIN